MTAALDHALRIPGHMRMQRNVQAVKKPDSTVTAAQEQPSHISHSYHDYERSIRILKRASELRYRSKLAQREESEGGSATATKDTYRDIFDGQLYQTLIEGGLFVDERDVALGLTTDGFQLF